MHNGYLPIIIVHRFYSRFIIIILLSFLFSEFNLAAFTAWVFNVLFILVVIALFPPLI